jgi:hypothetical protein
MISLEAPRVTASAARSDLRGLAPALARLSGRGPAYHGMLAYSDRTPWSRRHTGANDVSSTPERKQEEATAHAKGKEGDQAAEKARE